MTDALRLVEDVLRQQGEGEAENRPRTRIPYPDGLFHYMAAAVPRQHAVGLKAYASSSSGAQFVVLLFDTQSNALLSILEADWLGRMRTGAASGVAAKALAAEGATVAGVIGAGGQAETQIEAIAAALSLKQIKVFSRTSERREGLIKRLQPGIDAELVPVASAEAAVQDSDLVTTITSAAEPVFKGEWLKEGAHVTAAGGNRPNRRELDSVTVSRADFIAVDSLEQAKLECGDLIIAAREQPGIWSRVIELGSILAGKNKGRTSPTQVTLFESQGVALEDVAVARYVYDRAREEGAGQSVRFGGAD
jgi:ornithine cyclodeaminase/alanine dehydrogenase-like protein (mu-crystallin family)